ncbi:MAG: endolytic transglycosylase MltG [Alphaproteobacteria bacterium]|nr:endolytic transglycosylase MltG [Alphaproteobacteria bacterium]
MRFISGCLIAFIITALALGAGGFYVAQQLQAPGPLNETKNIVIPRGSGGTAIAQKLEKEGVISSALFFKLGYVLAQHPELKAGEYQFTPHMALPEIIDKMARGDIVKRKFTMPEGRTSMEIVQILNAEPALSGTIIALPPEGSLMPDTYQFTLGDDRNAKIKDMQKAMQDALLQIWAQRDADNPLQTPEQLLTLASIVEKETGVAAERPRVAGVFMNRLRKGMMLQSDPTVSYGITGGRAPLGRLLTSDDLRKPTLYNTYTIAALPPGPIANPGKAALLAAAKPEKNDFIYFVADGSGGHAFAATLEQHNQNVAKWRKLNGNK